MKYFKYNWDESLGGELEHWGKSEWFVELDSESWTTRQIQIFENGKVLMYHEAHKSDEYGMLNDQKTKVNEFTSLGGLEITHDEFEEKWKKN
jgi:hypothetical protein